MGIFCRQLGKHKEADIALAEYLTQACQEWKKEFPAPVLLRCCYWRI